MSFELVGGVKLKQGTEQSARWKPFAVYRIKAAGGGGMGVMTEEKALFPSTSTAREISVAPKEEAWGTKRRGKIEETTESLDRELAKTFVWEHVAI